jgi:hypothetical protein
MSVLEGVNYGQGRVFSTDAAGATHEVGELTSVDLEFSVEKAEYKGPYDIVRASVIKTKKLSGKASSGKFDGKLLAKCLGASTTTGATAKTIHYTERKTIAASVTVDHAANYSSTLVVRDAAGKDMTAVGSNPAIGQYSVAAGVYSFHASEPAGTATIEYLATAQGTSHKVTAGLQTVAPTFKLVLSQPDIEGTPHTLTIFAAVIDKLSKGGKAESFSENSLDFTAQADSNGDLCQFDE